MDIDQEECLKRGVSIEILVRNMKLVDRIRCWMCIFSGLVCGLIGITGIYGLLFYISTYIFVSFFIIFSKMGGVGNLSKYTNSRFVPFLLQDSANHALSFTLFWTLFYTLVYVY